MMGSAVPNIPNLVGAPGHTGVTGPVGSDGLIGPTGAIGPVGPIGPTGLVGMVGVVGPSGPVGFTGTTGSNGVIGVAGPTGFVGPMGPDGEPGSAGVSGITGSTGFIGPVGPTGLQGASGFAGVAGSTGWPGVVGMTGPTGATGPVGAVGYPSSAMIYKNLIINGDFQVNQRLSDDAITISSNIDYPCMDKWIGTKIGNGVFTVQRATDQLPPTNASYATKIVVTTPDTSLSSYEYYLLQQRIEGSHCMDLLWGTSSAKTVTLSFWARSSISGVLGGSLTNKHSSDSRSRSFTVSLTANNWTKATITMSGCTDGTWQKDFRTGIVLSFSLGAGSSLVCTPGSWRYGTYYSATSATNFISTSGATLYIADVQLEIGNAATDYERLPYWYMLRRCWRYRQVYFPSYSGYGQGSFYCCYPVFEPMRTLGGVDPSIIIARVGDFVVTNCSQPDVYVSPTGTNYYLYTAISSLGNFSFASWPNSYILLDAEK